MENSIDIFNHIDIKEIRKLLIHYPTLCSLFELLCIHINSLIKINKVN